MGQELRENLALARAFSQSINGTKDDPLIRRMEEERVVKMGGVLPEEGCTVCDGLGWFDRGVAYEQLDICHQCFNGVHAGKKVNRLDRATLRKYVYGVEVK